MNDHPRRGDVYWITLDPALGSETKKTRPCVILSNNAQNKKSQRLIVAPITSNVKSIYPFEAQVKVQERLGKVMADQLRVVDKQRLGKKLDSLDIQTIIEIEKAIKVALGLA